MGGIQERLEVLRGIERPFPHRQPLVMGRALFVTDASTLAIPFAFRPFYISPKGISIAFAADRNLEIIRESTRDIKRNFDGGEGVGVLDLLLTL